MAHFVIDSGSIMQMEKNMNTGASKFVCDICGTEYDSVNDLDEHKQEHSRRVKAEENDQQNIREDIGAAGMPTSPVR